MKSVFSPGSGFDQAHDLLSLVLETLELVWQVVSGGA